MTAPTAPEPCLNDRCFSPVACEGFGYCRERNIGMAPTPAQIEARRNIAFGRRLREQRLAKARGVTP